MREDDYRSQRNRKGSDRNRGHHDAPDRTTDERSDEWLARYGERSGVRRQDGKQHGERRGERGAYAADGRAARPDTERHGGEREWGFDAQAGNGGRGVTSNPSMPYGDREPDADRTPPRQQSDERWQQHLGSDANGSGRMRASEYGYGGQGTRQESATPPANPGTHFGKGPKGYARSDDRIREDVNESLFTDHHVDASEIEVQVAQGEVTLTGTVRSREEKRRAEDRAAHCSGVHDVHNRIRVQRPEPSSTDGSNSAARTAAGSSPGTTGDGPPNNEANG